MQVWEDFLVDCFLKWKQYIDVYRTRNGDVICLFEMGSLGKCIFLRNEEKLWYDVGTGVLMAFFCCYC